MASRSYRYYCFFDESGSIEQKETAHVVSCLIVANSMQAVNNVITTTRQRHRKSIRNQSFLHAVQSDDVVRKTLLQNAANQNGMQIAACIFDKKYWLDRGKQASNENVTNKLIGYTLIQALARAGAAPSEVCVVLEQFSTNTVQNKNLLSHITECIDISANQVHLVKKNNSEWGSGVQVADFAAWSLFQKYERNEPNYWELISPIIVHEGVVGLDGEGNIKPKENFWK